METVLKVMPNVKERSERKKKHNKQTERFVHKNLMRCQHTSLFSSLLNRCRHSFYLLLFSSSSSWTIFHCFFYNLHSFFIILMQLRLFSQTDLQTRFNSFNINNYTKGEKDWERKSGKLKVFMLNLQSIVGNT